MAERSKSCRFTGMNATLSQQTNLALLGRRHGRDPHAADWLNSRKQNDRSNHILLAMELRQDGGREFLHSSVRGLYKYVLEAIATPFKVPITTTTHAEETESVSSSSSSTKNKQTTTNTKETLSSDKENVQDEEEESHEDLTFRERLGGYIHPRDLRRLTTPFSASNEPELMVRRHVILCNFDPLRAIILRDRLLVIVPEGADSLLVDLERRVRGGMEEYENLVFGDASDEDKDASIHRYQKKPSSVTMNKAKRKITKAVKNAVKKPAALVKNAMGRNSSKHPSVTVPPPPPPPTLTPTMSALASDTKSDDPTNPNDNDDEDEEEFAELQSSEWEELKGNKWKELSFELQCTDAILHVVTNGLYEETFDLQQSALQCIRNIMSNQNGLSDEPLVDVRHITDSLSEMDSRVKRYMTSIDRILNEDEDLALMNLTRLMLYPERFVQSTTEDILEEEGQEPSFLIEAHLSTVYTLQNVLHLIKGQIDSASELVDRKQDAARNKILLANTIISVFSLCVGSASLVGSFFGMNLTNHLETHGNAWAIVLGSTMAMSVVIGVFGIQALIWSGALPRMAVLYRQT